MEVPADLDGLFDHPAEDILLAQNAERTSCADGVILEPQTPQMVLEVALVAGEVTAVFNPLPALAGALYKLIAGKPRPVGSIVLSEDVADAQFLLLRFLEVGFAFGFELRRIAVGVIVDGIGHLEHAAVVEVVDDVGQILFPRLHLGEVLLVVVARINDLPWLQGLEWLRCRRI
jgi:hypothetical protein